MTSRRHRRAAPKPERHVWVFSEPNSDVSPTDLARLLGAFALRAAATQPKEEADDE